MRDPSLRHVYASLAEFNDMLTTGGAAALTNAANNARKLEMLDEVSRLIDTRARRGNGFGPKVATVLYDGSRNNVLYMRADLNVLDEITVRPSQTADPVTPTLDTDFFLAGLGSYDPPFRKVILHGHGAPTDFGRGRQTVSITGTWTYPYRTRLLTATLDGETGITDTDTEIPVSAADEFSPAMTILVDDEQMYVTAVTVGEDSVTLTVERGVNGTTAAAHDADTGITRYVYDDSVHTCALRLAERRWKARDAGADGTEGGGELGTITPRESEDTIIRRMLRPVMLAGNV